MKNKDELDRVWDAVLVRLEQEGFSASDILQSMMRAAVGGLVERIGFHDTAALTVASLRRVQPQDAAAA